MPNAWKSCLGNCKIHSIDTSQQCLCPRDVLRNAEAANSFLLPFPLFKNNYGWRLWRERWISFSAVLQHWCLLLCYLLCTATARTCCAECNSVHETEIGFTKNKKPTHACMGNRWRGDYFCSGLSICAACKSSAQLLFTLVQCAV